MEFLAVLVILIFSIWVLKFGLVWGYYTVVGAASLFWKSCHGVRQLASEQNYLAFGWFLFPFFLFAYLHFKSDADTYLLFGTVFAAGLMLLRGFIRSLPKTGNNPEDFKTEIQVPLNESVHTWPPKTMEETALPEPENLIHTNNHSTSDMPFLYKVTFFSLTYELEEEFYEDIKTEFGPGQLSRYPFEKAAAPLEAMLNKMGADDWELISVQPFYKPIYQQQSAEFTGLLSSANVKLDSADRELLGYYYYWKKANQA